MIALRSVLFASCTPENDFAYYSLEVKLLVQLRSRAITAAFKLGRAQNETSPIKMAEQKRKMYVFAYGITRNAPLSRSIKLC